MNAERHTDNSQPTKGGPLPGLLRPPIVFLVAILLGIALNRAWPLPFQATDSLGARPPVYWLRRTALALVVRNSSHRAFGPTSPSRSTSSASLSPNEMTVTCRDPAVTLLQGR